MTINNLTYSDTFKKWFDTTNSVISEINGITVHNILAGDGIGITSASNIFTISHASNVSGGVTFSGNVNFTGIVSFTNNPTTSSSNIISITPKTTGLTAGNVVRIDSVGLTLAKADSALNAEVLGVVVNETGNSNIVAISGLIDNTSFSKTIENVLGVAGATLFAGEAYFLSSITAGTITTNEPVIYGQVSKPILLGVTAQAGSLLTYRGILLEGISAGITAELDNKIIVEIDYSGTDSTTGNPIKVGDPVCFYRDESASEALINTNKTSFKLYGKLNNSTQNCVFIPDMSEWTNSTILTGKEFLGLISKIINNIGSKYILEVTVPGGSFNTTISELDSNFYLDTSSTNYLNLNSSSKLVTATSTRKFINLLHVNDGFNTVKIIIVPSGSSVSGGGEPSPPAYITSGITAATEYYNIIPNGAFTVWQRPAVIKSAFTTSYTDDYLLQPNQAPATDANGRYTYYTYKFLDTIADRWFVIRNLDYYTYNVGLNKFIGLTAGSSVLRREFSSDQAEVSGSPLFYIDCKFNYNLSPVGQNSKRPRIENIQSNARLCQNQRVTFSFWGKSTVSGSTLDIIYNQYRPSYSNEAGFTAALEGRTNVTVSSGGITLGTNWQQYSRSFDVNVAGFTLASTELGWFGMGFEFPSSTATISLAQAQLNIGNQKIEPLAINYNDELHRCKKLYQTSFGPGITYINTGTSANRFGSANRENTEQPVVLCLTGNSTSFTYPVPMYLAPTTVDHFSPYSGRYLASYVKDSFGGVNKDNTSITPSDNQSLPWQRVAHASAAINKPRVASTGTDLSFTPYSTYASVTSLSGFLNITYLDTVIFDYVLDADITNSAYSSSFSKNYTSTKIYY